MADLATEVWVDNDPKIGSSTPPRRKATPLEAYLVLTRRMLTARAELKDDEEAQEKSDSDYADWLDAVWDKLAKDEIFEAREQTWSIMNEFLVPHHERDTYTNENNVVHWRATGKRVEHLWDVKS